MGSPAFRSPGDGVEVHEYGATGDASEDWDAVSAHDEWWTE